MFNFFKKKPKKPPPPAQNLPPSPPIRDTLFGDAPLSEWPPAAATSHELEPWKTFVQAREFQAQGQKDKAIALYRDITERPDLEARHYLQAWHFLRQLGVQPTPEQAKIVYGVVVEVAMHGGCDYLAAYTDGSARYYNYTGAGVIWEKPDNSLESLINQLLDVGSKVVSHIGPWDKERPPAPQGDFVRLNMLTPSGLHFGYGPFSALAADPIGGALIGAATILMKAMTDKALNKGQQP